MEKNYTLGYHLAAFLDVLGQRNKFRQLQLPRTPQDYARVQQVLMDTAGFILNLRGEFRKEFEAFEAGIPSMRARTQDSLRPHFVGFSDSFVVSVALRSNSGDMTPFVRIFSALSAASIVMSKSLARKHVLRGGIDVGLATEITPEEIYGTALERAYVLESDRAQYPRILIGDELWKFLSAALVEFENHATQAAETVKALIQRIMRLISTDGDGERVLDYLGPVIAETATPDDAKHMIHPAYQFVVMECERFSSEGNAKMGRRYALLRGYFESRLSLWGLTASKP